MQMRRSTTQELMDDPAGTREELRGNLRDLGRINRLFGGHAAVRSFLDEALPAWRRRGGTEGAAFRVLDVATGGADVPAVVVDWGRHRGVPVRVVGVDRHPVIASLAAASSAALTPVTVIRADARALPFADGAFDVSLCTLALHHLAVEEGLTLIRRLDRLSRTGFLLVDLLRSPSGYGGVWLMTRLSLNRLIRHDGPLSVRRARSWEEYRGLAAASGIAGLRLERQPLFRVTLSRIR
jgi:methyltransferase family protein